MSNARPVTEEEAPHLHAMVKQLAARANLPKPAVYLMETDTPNAFATGRSPEKGVVSVTTGLMRLLDRDELAGVIAHELAHIRNRDTLLSSMVATIAGAITMIAEWAQWSMIFGALTGGQEEEEGEGGNPIGSFLMLFLAPIAAMMIQFAISRAREFKADADGAAILGDPLPLASALEKLEWSVKQQAPLAVNPATSHLYIVNPVMGHLAGLFRTHPATEQRILRLRELARQQVVTA
jgi:heat shock protein HtpX